MSAEPRSLLADAQVTRYLTLRLIGRGGDRGISSDALVAFSAHGERVPEDTWPHDYGDFSRCLSAFCHAPPALQDAMLPQIVEWGAELVAHEGRWYDGERKTETQAVDV